MASDSVFELTLERVSKLLFGDLSTELDDNGDRSGRYDRSSNQS